MSLYTLAHGVFLHCFKKDALYSPIVAVFTLLYKSVFQGHCHKSPHCSLTTASLLNIMPKSQLIELQIYQQRISRFSQVHVLKTLTKLPNYMYFRAYYMSAIRSAMCFEFS